MKAKELLEQDKDRFMSKIGQDLSPTDGILAVEDQLDRILYRYCTDQTPPQVAMHARLSFAALKASLPLMDEVGEIKIYEQMRERTPKDALKKERGILAAAIAAVLLIASVMLASCGGGNGILIFLSICSGSAALVTAFLQGQQKGKPVKAQASQRKIEKCVDAEKLYHDLSTLMTVMDENLEEIESSAAEADRTEETETGPEVLDSSVLDADFLSLLASVLESVYVSGEDAYAQEIVAQIRFFLHKYGIEMVDYSADQQQLFDLMPSLHEQTIRPALVHEGVLLSKGLSTLKTTVT